MGEGPEGKPDGQIPTTVRGRFEDVIFIFDVSLPSVPARTHRRNVYLPLGDGGICSIPDYPAPDVVAVGVPPVLLPPPAQRPAVPPPRAGSKHAGILQESREGGGQVPQPLYPPLWQSNQLPEAVPGLPYY